MLNAFVWRMLLLTIPLHLMTQWSRSRSNMLEEQLLAGNPHDPESSYLFSISRMSSYFRLGCYVTSDKSCDLSGYNLKQGSHNWLALWSKVQKDSVLTWIWLSHIPWAAFCVNSHHMCHSTPRAYWTWDSDSIAVSQSSHPLLLGLQCLPATLQKASHKSTIWKV